MLTVYPFADWTKEVAVQQNVAYLDHLNYTIKLFEDIGYEAGFSLFAPNDRTHTNPAGAIGKFKLLKIFFAIVYILIYILYLKNWQKL